MWAARRRGARLAVVNGRLSEHSFAGYRRIRWLVGRLLGQIDLLAVQDAAYAQRFESLGARRESIHVTGSMKYDGATTDRGNPATLRLAALAGFQADDVIFLAGSTQEPEEAVAIDVFRRLQPAWPKLRLLLVPRHPDRFEAVAKLLDASGLAWQRRSELGRLPPSAGINPAAACRRRKCLACSWSMPWASWGPGGGRHKSPSSAAAWAIAAVRT